MYKFICITHVNKNITINYLYNEQNCITQKAVLGEATSARPVVPSQYAHVTHAYYSQCIKHLLLFQYNSYISMYVWCKLQHLKIYGHKIWKTFKHNNNTTYFIHNNYITVWKSPGRIASLSKLLTSRTNTHIF